MGWRHSVLGWLPLFANWTGTTGIVFLVPIQTLVEKVSCIHRSLIKNDSLHRRLGVSETIRRSIIDLTRSWGSNALLHRQSHACQQLGGI